MDNNKSLLRHEILNIVTLLNFLVVDSELERQKKDEILSHLKILGLLFAEEDAFLEQKRGFFEQNLRLDELLQLLGYLLEEDFQSAGVLVDFPSTEMWIRGDFDVLKNGLEHILRQLMAHCRKIKIEVNEEGGYLEIRYDGNYFLKFEDKPLLEFLNKGLSHQVIHFQVAVKVMQMSGAQVEFEAGVIKITFAP